MPKFVHSSFPATEHDQHVQVHRLRGARVVVLPATISTTSSLPPGASAVAAPQQAWRACVIPVVQDLLEDVQIRARGTPRRSRH